MGTNVPAKHPNMKRVAVTAGAETAITFDGVPTLINFVLQVVESVALYISFDSGGTFSTDNYFTLKSGATWNEQDINWTPPANAMYVRSASGNITVELIYWG